MRSFLLLFAMLFSITLCAQPVCTFDYKVFRSTDQTYIETYLEFSSPSLNYAQLDNGNFQAKVSTTITFSQGDSTIINYSKTDILSPETADSVYIDFIDMQRFNLAPGTYQMEVLMVDMYSPEKKSQAYKQKLVIEEPLKTADISDILFINDLKNTTTPSIYTRGNMDLFPYISNYFPADVPKLNFYAELYNTKTTFPDSTGAFVFTYKITTPKNGKTFRSFQQITRQKAKEIVPVLFKLDISTLPSGDYNLVLEIRNTKNELVTSKTRQFQRNNPDAIVPDSEIEQLMLDNSFVGALSSLDTIREYIDCLRPIANDREQDAIDNQDALYSSLELKKKFFYTFWAKHKPQDPAGGWQSYKGEVALVNKIFSTRIKKGYSTDRGRVYLQYGPPNTRTERPTEPSAYPYEIWHYYKINQFSNKKFVFWNQDLVSNDYELLHSDMFGEVRNQNWENYLSKRTSPIDNPDKRKPAGQFGGNSGDFFKNPR